MRRATVLIIILLACLLLVACGKDDVKVGDKGRATTDAPAVTTATAPARTATAPPATATTPAIAPRSTQDGCRAVATPEPLANPDRRRSRVRLAARRVHIVTLQTNCGTIRIRLAAGAAPKTTSAFAGLVRNGFFDGLTFHRIAAPGGNDYVIQGGDPLGTGNGGPGYSVVEPPPRKTKYDRYVVAMAKTETEQPGTSASQFFIVTAKTTPLPPEYALLGRVVGGKEIVRRIAAVPTDPLTERPVDPVVITAARIRSSRRSSNAR